MKEISSTNRTPLNATITADKKKKCPQENFGFYCGRLSHFIAKCCKKKSKESGKRPARPFYCQMLQEEIQEVKKRTDPIDVCAVVLGNDDVGPKPHLFLNALIATLGGWTIQQALVDPGAQVNLIFQLLVKESGWTPSKDVHVSVAGWKSHEITTYRLHELTLCMINSNSHERKIIKHFIAVDIDSYELLLGLPWAGKCNPTIK